MAWFSSDRTIREYAADIWDVPVKPAAETDAQSTVARQAQRKAP
jgi:starch phosphorylase